MDSEQTVKTEAPPKRPTYFPRYIIIREVGEKNMVKAVNYFTAEGYEPAGGVSAYKVQGNIVMMRGGRRETVDMLGYVQALWLPPDRPLVEVPAVESLDEAINGKPEGQPAS